MLQPQPPPPPPPPTIHLSSFNYALLSLVIIVVEKYLKIIAKFKFKHVHGICRVPLSHLPLCKQCIDITTHDQWDKQKSKHVHSICTIPLSHLP